MTPTFITLPSGLRVNTTHIIHYGQSEHDGQIKLILTDEPTPWLETMALFEMDALLQPQGTPIVSPILELRLPRPGEAVCFKREGKHRHGIVVSPQVEDDKIIIVSDGDEYQYDLPSSYTVKLQ